VLQAPTTQQDNLPYFHPFEYCFLFRLPPLFLSLSLSLSLFVSLCALDDSWHFAAFLKQPFFQSTLSGDFRGFPRIRRAPRCPYLPFRVLFFSPRNRDLENRKVVQSSFKQTLALSLTGNGDIHIYFLFSARVPIAYYYKM